MAMQWVKNNIEAFGGDPDNITLGGQSAGGGSVINQIMHGPDNLFNRAVCHSGMFKMPGNNIMTPRELSEAEKLGEEFFKIAGCSTLAEIRKLSTEQLRKIWSDYGGWMKSVQTWLPVKDNKFIFYEMFNALDTNKFPQIPMMTGYTTDEFMMGDVNAIKTAVNIYQEKCEQNKSKVPNYVYHFDVDIPGWDNPGKFHSVDLWFWFETLAKCWRPFTGKYYDVSRKMCNYLSNFIKTGNPNGKDCDGSQMENWEPYSMADQNPMTFKVI